MPNRLLDQAARERVNNGLGPLAPGYCQRWVRETVQSVYGSRFDVLLQSDGENCQDARSFGLHVLDLRGRGKLPAGVTVLNTSDPLKTQVGDILVKLLQAGSPGHVGIAVTGNLVAENSSTKFGRQHGALGYRDLLQSEARPGGWFGAFDLVVRLSA